MLPRLCTWLIMLAARYWAHLAPCYNLKIGLKWWQLQSLLQPHLPREIDLPESHMHLVHWEPWIYGGKPKYIAISPRSQIRIYIAKSFGINPELWAIKRDMDWGARSKEVWKKKKGYNVLRTEQNRMSKALSGIPFHIEIQGFWPVVHKESLK